MTAVVPYSPDAVATARLLDRLLQGTGHRVVLDWDEDAEPGVCIVERDRPLSSATLLRAGEQVVVETNGAWRIEAVS